MRINHNLMALNAHRQLGTTNTNSAKAMEKLSSGFRINRAGDDAAGLAISEKMRAQIRGLNQASRNAQDGISLIQTAEGALNETHSILQRMRELGNQAASDTNVTVDRQEIQKEINQLTSEINRIGNATEFNTMNLLDGSRSSAYATGTTTTLASAGSIDVNYAEGVTWTMTGDQPTLLNGTTGDQVGLSAGGDFTGVVGTAGGTVTITKSSGGNLVVAMAGSAAGIFSATDVVSLNSDGDAYEYNNHGVSFSISTTDFAAMDDGDNVEITVASADVTAENKAVATSWDNNTSGAVTITSGITLTETQDNADARSIELEGVTTGGFTIQLLDEDDNVIIEDSIVLTAGATSYDYDNHGVSFTIKISANASASAAFTLSTRDITETSDQSLSFQVGANEDQAMSLSLADMTSTALGISEDSSGTSGFTSSLNVTDGTDNTSVEYALDVSTHENAANAVTVINNAIESVSSERAKLGAVQNRLEHTIRNLDTSAENLQSAESRIRDVDMAKEMMNFTKQNILQQAATAMLAQANQAPQGVLQLLR